MPMTHATLFTAQLVGAAVAGIVLRLVAWLCGAPPPQGGWFGLDRRR